jgi:hypothetical protein
MQTKNSSLADIRARLHAWAAGGRTQVHEFDSKDVLTSAGLPIPQRGAAPAHVVKICCDAAMHKSEYGLVQLRVAPQDVPDAIRLVTGNAASAGLAGGVVLIEEMVTDGLLEWFVGCRNDSTFGPIVVLGVGGIYADHFGDPEIRLAPLSQAEAESAIRAHRAFVIIDGARGKPRADVVHFAKVVAAISQFYSDTHDLIGELDLNPVIVRPAGSGDSVVIADASIVLG